MTDDEYDAALREIDELMGRDMPPGSTDAMRFDVLVAQVEQYEREHFPFPED